MHGMYVVGDEAYFPTDATEVARLMTSPGMMEAANDLLAKVKDAFNRYGIELVTSFRTFHRCFFRT